MEGGGAHPRSSPSIVDGAARRPRRCTASARSSSVAAILLAHGAAVLAQEPEQALRAPGVVPLASAQCPNERWRDSCGVCGGDGGSCTSLAMVSRPRPCAVLLHVTEWIGQREMVQTDGPVKRVEPNTDLTSSHVQDSCWQTAD
ncbi:hypothetical protein T484DRAFT_1746430 [Baffinella frigidus]|nr:hypothetical protein T484DRAFT_1746430 [Cryptophyta sp. CCMP2293]